MVCFERSVMSRSVLNGHHDGDLVVNVPLGVQLEIVGLWVIFGRISAAAP